MKPLFKNQNKLKRHMRDPVLIAFDFDGTLAPLVSHRARAGMPAKTKALLSRLCSQISCAVVTGRSLKDARAKLRGIKNIRIVGNHGAEGGGAKPALRSRRLTKDWKNILAAELRKCDGIDIEDKSISLSIHYVRAPHRPKSKIAIQKALKKIRGARIVGGSNVFNVVDPAAPTKGDAVLNLAKASRSRTIIFVGDDLTDEDVFKKRGVTGILVGKRKSKAKYFISRQSDINRLLLLFSKLAKL